ncbi:unnamed protein product [Phytophthora fragariaefolia]|uniref:Unnamed protein product n=1 Tax=Phytophthora fragariaefolia TaxID=1490495 RepID=A0A9W7CYJ5_9STRA|nr:unnamed protein product [Phytophthora fragariaefolia]
MAPPHGPPAPGVNSPSRLTRTGSTDSSVFSQPSTRPSGGTGSGSSERSSALDGAGLSQSSEIDSLLAAGKMIDRDAGTMADSLSE